MGLLKNIRDSFKKSKEKDTVKNDNIVETTGNNSLAGNDEMKNNFEEYVRISKEQKEQIENYFAEDYESAKKRSEELGKILKMQEDKMNEYYNNQRKRMNKMFNSDFAKRIIEESLEIASKEEKNVYISKLKDCGVDEKSAMDLYEVKELFNSIKINKNYDQIEVAKKLLMHFLEKNVNLLNSFGNQTMKEHGDDWNFAQKETHGILVEAKLLDTERVYEKKKEFLISNKKNKGYSTDDYEGR